MPAGAHSADDAVASAASMKYTKLSMQLTHRECNNMLTKQLMKQRLPAAAAAAKFIGHCQPLWQVHRCTWKILIVSLAHGKKISSWLGKLPVEP